MQITRDIVVMGASAGGIGAMKGVLQGLPSDLPAAVLLVMHVWPTAHSALPEVLGRMTPLPVAHAVDGENIERSRIYVAPPDFHLMVENDRLVVIRGPRENRARPAINPLFRSAAAGCGPRVIGVILSGTLDDGCSGLWAIKRQGGLALVQDPLDAEFSEMPQSAIDAVAVDHLASSTQLGRLIDERCRELVAIDDSLPEGALPKIRDDGTKTKGVEMVVDQFASRSVYSCPECNGALWEVKEGGNLSFRCHAGHAYTAKTLRDEQDVLLEQSLWSALRALQESAALDERLATRSDEAGLGRAAGTYRKTAEEKRAQEQRVRHFLANLHSISNGTTPMTPFKF